MRRLLPVLVVVAVTLVGTAPALAHGDDGNLEVLDAVPTPAGDEVTYTVELTYANDGDPVDGAIVSATVRGPGGPQAPLTVASIGEGWYAVPIQFPGPGRWTVTFTAVEPAATLEVTYEVPATPPSTTAAPATTTTTPSGTDPTIVDDDADLDDGPPAGLVVGAVLAGAVLVGAAVILFLRRRSLD